MAFNIKSLQALSEGERAAYCFQHLAAQRTVCGAILRLSTSGETWQSAYRRRVRIVEGSGKIAHWLGLRASTRRRITLIRAAIFSAANYLPYW